MKSWIFKIFIVSAAVLSTASVSIAQNVVRRPVTAVNLTPNTSILPSVIHEILTLAAPQFNQTPENFIRLYYTCGCIEIIQLGPNTYRVIFGGVGIQIVIDATRRCDDVESTD